MPFQSFRVARKGLGWAIRRTWLCPEKWLPFEQEAFGPAIINIFKMSLSFPLVLVAAPCAVWLEGWRWHTLWKPPNAAFCGQCWDSRLMWTPESPNTRLDHGSTGYKEPGPKNYEGLLSKAQFPFPFLKMQGWGCFNLNCIILLQQWKRRESNYSKKQTNLFCNFNLEYIPVWGLSTLPQGLALLLLLPMETWTGAKHDPPQPSLRSRNSDIHKSSLRGTTYSRSRTTDTARCHLVAAKQWNRPKSVAS